jgi:hypothetical protein
LELESRNGRRRDFTSAQARSPRHLPRFFNGYSISGTAHSPTARTPAPLVSDDARVAVRVATLARVTSNPRRVVNASRGVRERTLPRARPARRIRVVGSSDTNGRAARPR